MRKSMQYLAVIGIVLLGGFVIGDGYVKTRHAEQGTSTLRATIAAMSIQQLARELRSCDPPSGAPINHDAAFCAEVMRVIEDRPLQAVAPERSSPPARPDVN